MDVPQLPTTLAIPTILSASATSAAPAALSSHVPVAMSDDYVRLAASMPSSTQLPHDFTMRFMAEHVRSLVACAQDVEQEYAAILPQMQFALQVERALESLRQDNFNRDDDSPLALLHSGWPKGVLPQTAERIMAQIGEHPAVLIPASSNGRPEGHAMYLRTLKDPGSEGAYTLRLFNASAFAADTHRKGFVDYHTRSDSGKWQTVYEVRGAHLGSGKNALNADTITELLRLYTTDDAQGWGGIPSVYQWVERMGTPHNPSSRRGQGLQKAPNCTHKSIMVFLRNTLSDKAFNLLKATLLTDGAKQVARRGTSPFLALAAERKAELATSKWQGAVRGIKPRPTDITAPRPNSNLPPLGYVGMAQATQELPERAGSGKASMQQGVEEIDGTPFKARSAAYFPSRDGAYAYAIISDEPDITQRLRHKLTDPDGTLLILKVPLTLKAKLLGKSTNVAVKQTRGEGDIRELGPIDLKATTSNPQNAATGAPLTGTFEGTTPKPSDPIPAKPRCPLKCTSPPSKAPSKPST